MINIINQLLFEAHELKKMGENELAEGFKDIARKILDHLAFEQELRARSVKKKDKKPGQDELFKGWVDKNNSNVI